MKESFAKTVECWNSLKASELSISSTDDNLTMIPETGKLNGDNDATNMRIGEVKPLYLLFL